jgi:steroid 5-alpha reductase family enzyme
MTWSIISPLLMTFLLLRVSGVAMLERTLKESKAGYADYINKTNAFFSGPVK